MRAARITELSRWLMLGTLIYAPWAFGGTRPWTIQALNVLVAVVAALWLTGAALERLPPKVPSALAILSLILLGYAWWMVVNAKFVYDPTAWTFQARRPWAASAPGSIDYNRSLILAFRVSALLGALCFLTDMSRSGRWRKRLVWTLALTGVSLALLGLVQRILAAPSILWQGEKAGETFFATYRYHSNAGAFLNLIWPLAAALGLIAWRRGQDRRVIACWSGAVLLCLCGLVISGARAASAIALFLLMLWVAWLAWQTRRAKIPSIPRSTVIVGAALLCLLVLSVAALAGLEVSARRWAKLQEIFSATNPRLLVDSVCLKMIPEASWFGFGPGTFRIAFPYFTNDLGDSISGIWRYAHQDYLQTLIEWGYVGGLLWASLLIGALLSGSRALRVEQGNMSFRDATLHFGVVTATAGALLHAMVDFPLQIASIQLYFAALLALLWSQPYWRRESVQA